MVLHLMLSCEPVPKLIDCALRAWFWENLLFKRLPESIVHGDDHGIPALLSAFPYGAAPVDTYVSLF
jgi:hypothetical protein